MYHSYRQNTITGTHMYRVQTRTIYIMKTEWLQGTCKIHVLCLQQTVELVQQHN